VVIDLSSMRAVRVDPETKTARAEGGATWGDFNDATHAFGLATTGGIISTTGVGGLTLGGGIGYLARGFGLSCDNLISADVVTADGTFLTASDKENEDLFWALRGGGGNFGVVTSFEFRVHPVKDIYGGPMFFELEHAADITGALSPMPPSSSVAFPRSRSSHRCRSSPKIVTGTHSARSWRAGRDRSRREKAITPLREVAPVVAEHVGPMPYPALNSAFDALVPPGLQHYWKANFVRELTDDVIEAHVEHGSTMPNVNSTVHLYPIDGACHRVGPDETAFGHRDASFAPVIAGMWPDAADNDKNIKWVRDYYKQQPRTRRRVDTSTSPPTMIRVVSLQTTARITASSWVKRKYDPDNLFHMNQNIDPKG
jgi:FAD/FMN-containing dehydrogenase